MDVIYEFLYDLLICGGDNFCLPPFLVKISEINEFLVLYFCIKKKKSKLNNYN